MYPLIWELTDFPENRINVLCTGKHRGCDTTTIVRIIPETLRAWDYANVQPLSPKGDACESVVVPKPPIMCLNVVIHHYVVLNPSGSA